MAVELPERVVVINDFSIARGGATALALLSVQGLSAMGIPVTYFAGDEGENPIFSQNNVEVVGLGQKRLLEANAAVSGLYNRPARQALAQWIAKHDTPRTVYHLHNCWQILSPSIFGALRAVKGRVFLSAHDFFLTCPNGAYMNYPKQSACPLVPLSAACITTNCDKRSFPHKTWRVVRQAVRRGLYNMPAQAPVILAIHPGMRPYLERGGIPGACIKVLLNPVTPFTAERILAENNSEILFVGRLDYEKGADIAAEAARQAGVRLSIAGDGPMMAKLQAQYPEVTFHGRVSKDVIGRIAASACALVMPTRYPEPFGLVAVEALWSGLPVILPGSSFLANDIGDAGVVFESGNVSALADSMRAVAADPNLRRQMSLAAHHGKEFLANTPEAWIAALADGYSRAVNEHPKVAVRA